MDNPPIGNARELAQRGAWRAAAKVCEDLVRSDGDDAETLLLWGRCLARLGRHPDAIGLLERAAVLVEGQDAHRGLEVEIQVELGFCARNTGRGLPAGRRRRWRERALDAYRRAAELAPEDTRLLASVRQLEDALAATADPARRASTDPAPGESAGAGTA